MIFRRLIAALLLGSFALSAGAAQPAPAEPPACRLVRFGVFGWSDIAAVTALTTLLLRDLGYRATSTELSIPVIFASLRNGDIDVFLGNWMPAQEADRSRYLADGSIDIVGHNLEHAKYTLAVPRYLYEAGLKDFSDIEKFAAPLDHSIYGIEPGTAANRLVLGLIQRNELGLGGFKLIESSEQGMVTQVERAYRSKKPIVFLAWDPHPMNLQFDLVYLSGGDRSFGERYGDATIDTITRAGYATECPNVGRLLRNLKFSLRGESEIMMAMRNRREQPEVAAAGWLRANQSTVDAWFEGVRGIDGLPASTMPEAGRVPRGTVGVEGWIVAHKIPLGDAITVALDILKARGAAVFDGVSATIRTLVNAATIGLQRIPATGFIVAIAALAWFGKGSKGLAVFVGLALLFILNQGYWASMMETLSLVLVATLVSATIGIPLGIVTAHHPRLYSMLHPILDLMQTLPTFVYLIPTLLLFGLGVVPALISTVVFVLPAHIRMTHLGISAVPRALLEAGESFGATPLQLLWKIELPSAVRIIFAGVTQCIMLSLSMVVIAGLVGAGGLGVPVVRALNSVQIGVGFEAGFVIVLLAIILDRFFKPREPTYP